MNRRGFFSLFAGSTAAVGVLPSASAGALSVFPLPRRAYIVRQAMLRIGWLAPGMTPSSEDMKHGLNVLSDMTAYLERKNALPADNEPLIALLADRLYWPEKLAMARAAVRSAPNPTLFVQDEGTCQCGHSMIWHGSRWSARYSTCCNQECPQFGIPMNPPRIGVTEFTDRAAIAAIQAEEAEWERQQAISTLKYELGSRAESPWLHREEDEAGFESRLYALQSRTQWLEVEEFQRWEARRLEGARADIGRQLDALTLQRDALSR
jgi:hypothetical protein